MRYRKEGKQRRRRAADKIVEIIPESVWKAAADDPSRRVDLVDAILEIVGKQLKLWMADRPSQR